MADVPDIDLPSHLLELRFGGRSIRENLHAALEGGTLRQLPDGRLAPPEKRAEPRAHEDTWLYINHPGNDIAPCGFLFNFLFEVVYARAQVPNGCRECYKVKASPTRFSELLALRNLARRFPYNTKCGPEVNYPYSQELYGVYIYCQGLEQARDAHRLARLAMDAETALRPAVKMRIKRGCSAYEMFCGPSDQWRFQAEQADLEAALLARFVPPRSGKPRQEFALLMRWVEIAHAIGDDSYLEFTKGRRLYPATVDYEP